MKRWQLESIIRVADNHRARKLELPDWRSEGLFSGHYKIEFRNESRLSGWRRRLVTIVRRRRV
ncbi:hypothetical protein [Desulfofustis limnaeus]|jgi:hypothetical protein|uniref:Type II toxin-antitoxin system RelE/ParE family toxin n=1 Tax=Desulfofustis limnaeus TaxID=2740163 RepID=A0ABN6M351_9BACT|nr:hypothetical protein [Desulfofustis limnaeus]MDX9895304.1 hypothetical protein [Desulfofustis sp.]BDD86439.1 hypothetical protein DPPLL_08040 [Desulfofustis limnaeus]